jgi:methyl-accepting chemotaxis protein
MVETSYAEIAVRLDELKQQLDVLAKQQAELASGIQELVQTFRQLSMHLGIAAEPYRTSKKSKEPPPGFG